MFGCSIHHVNCGASVEDWLMCEALGQSQLCNWQIVKACRQAFHRQRYWEATKRAKGSEDQITSCRKGTKLETHFFVSEGKHYCSE
mmetsp:Transcript_30569/g.56417  ORF Transcript_30569/g.56417 Transcript_30569/m.56417 type:complete len:86 (-) Transcript_30569:409-666(-)